MRTFPMLSALALVTSLAAPVTPGQADTPPLAYSSQVEGYAQDVCFQRAKAAFASDGWQGVHPSGNPALAVGAFKGELVGIILCLNNNGVDDSLAIIFVTGGDNGQPDAERDRLEYYMG